MKKTLTNHIGSWSFFAGVIVAICSGFVELRTAGAIFLLFVGLIVGIVNITDKHIQPFLYSGVIIVISSSLGSRISSLIPWMENILMALMLIFVPATIIVALKYVYSMDK